MAARLAGCTVAQAAPEDTSIHAYTLRGGGGFAPAQPGREQVLFDGRRDENVSDARHLAGEALRGESTPAPCPRQAVRTQPRPVPVAIQRRGVQGFAFG